MAKEKKTSKPAAKKGCKSAAPFKPLTKTQIIQQIAESTELTKKDVSAVLDTLSKVIAESLATSNDATFTLPGLIKIEKQYVAAKPAQKNVPDPFHPGKTIDRAAKPAHYKIKVKPLKGLKDMA
ncbi:MAG: HU family DNA-binding protein [Thermoguttaceae bacterium]|jgi:nucleoid DNA-binding protein